MRHAPTDFENAFTELINFIRQRFNIENAILRKLTGGRLITVAAYGYGPEERNTTIIPGRGITGRAARTGKTICINDLETYTGDYIPGIIGAKSNLCIPLVDRWGSVVGTLNIESSVKDNFSGNRVNLLEMMCKKFIDPVSAWQAEEPAVSDQV